MGGPRCHTLRLSWRQAASSLLPADTCHTECGILAAEECALLHHLLGLPSLCLRLPLAVHLQVQQGKLATSEVMPLDQETCDIM